MNRKITTIARLLTAAALVIGMTACATPRAEATPAPVAEVVSAAPAVAETALTRSEQAFVDGVRALEPLPAQTTDAEILDFGSTLCAFIWADREDELVQPDLPYHAALIKLGKQTLCR